MSLFEDHLLLGTGSPGLLQPHCSGLSALNSSAGAPWFHLCIESYVIRSWMLTFVLRFLQILWAFLHTNGCLFSLHYHWPSQGLSVVLLWHIAGISNSCFLTFLCISHSSNLSQVRKERFLSPFCDCYLAQWADPVALDIITCMKIPLLFRYLHEDWVGNILHMFPLSFYPKLWSMAH